MNVTIKDVAKKANVSPSTVSRVIADSPKISEGTKKRVHDAMKELNYHPNAIARSLVSRSTNTIGVIMPSSAHLSLANPFFPEVLRGISACANERGYYVLLSIEDDEAKKNNIDKIVKAGMVDGIIMLYSRLEDDIFNTLMDKNFPFVMVGKPVNGNMVNYVDNDNISAAFEGTSYLINKGKKKISIITGPLNLVVSLDRLEGYKRALMINNMDFSEELVFSGDFSKETGYSAIEKFIKNNSGIDAVLATDDILALGAIKAIKDTGLNIPDDISIISFNNIPTAEFLTPALSSIDINPFELGFEATDLLFQRLNNDKRRAKARIIPTKLIIRGSC